MFLKVKYFCDEIKVGTIYAITSIERIYKCVYGVMRFLL